MRLYEAVFPQISCSPSTGRRKGCCPIKAIEALRLRESICLVGAEHFTAAASIPSAPAVPPTEVPATQISSQGTAVSFASDVLPIFESRCKNCHGGNKIEEGLVLLSYADIIKGSKNGPVVIPGSANDSLLVELLVNQKMPKRGPKLTPSQIQPIIDWINQGALEN